MDVVMQVVWTALALAAVVLVLRRPGPHGLWWLVAAACSVVAVDKAIDVQTMLFDGVKVVVGAALGALGADGERSVVKVVLLLAATAVTLAALVWLVRRDHARDRDKLLACAGLALVVGLVGVRFVPGFAWLADERAGWVVEGIGCALLAIGLRGGFRRAEARRR